MNLQNCWVDNLVVLRIFKNLSFECSFCVELQSILYGGGCCFLPSPNHVESYEFKLVHGLSMHHFGLLKCINCLLFGLCIKWHIHEFNLKTCLSPISKLSHFFSCWELNKAPWICIPLQNKKLGKFFTINITWQT
jgi:hypothetical protein